MAGRRSSGLNLFGAGFQAPGSGSASGESGRREGEATGIMISSALAPVEIGAPLRRRRSMPILSRRGVTRDWKDELGIVKAKGYAFVEGGADVAEVVDGCQSSLLQNRSVYQRLVMKSHRS